MTKLNRGLFVDGESCLDGTLGFAPVPLMAENH